MGDLYWYGWNLGWIISCERIRSYVVTVLLFRGGGDIKYDLRYEQKPIYFAIFTNNIWSYLLRMDSRITMDQVEAFTPRTDNLHVIPT